MMAETPQQTGNPGEQSGPLRRNDEPPSRHDPLDLDGVPIASPVADWLDLFEAEGGATHPRATRLLLSILRFCRGDGSPVFGPKGRRPDRLRTLLDRAVRSNDPSLQGVLGRWIPDRAGPATMLPDASEARGDRVLSVLRPDWSPRGDLVAIDHRRPGAETWFEVSARGQAWLGPSWDSGEIPSTARPARPTRWSSGPFAIDAEWSFKLGSKSTTRSAVLLRGRSMALLAQQDDGRSGASEIRLDLGADILATPIEGSRALLLSSGAGKPTARLIPLGLPCHDRPTDLGSIAVDAGRVVIRQSGEARRRWIPVLIGWGKPPSTWRALTVAARSKACPASEAVAYRVAWGPRDEGLVVYRSLEPPALRSFLGHQTNARSLVGAFTRSGDVRPILKVD